MKKSISDGWKLGFFILFFFFKSHKVCLHISHSFFKAISKTFYLLFSLSVEWANEMPECEQDKSKLFLIEEVYEMPECEQDKSKLFNRRGVYVKIVFTVLLSHKYIFQFYIYEWRQERLDFFFPFPILWNLFSSLCIQFYLSCS